MRGRWMLGLIVSCAGHKCWLAALAEAGQCRGLSMACAGDLVWLFLGGSGGGMQRPADKLWLPCELCIPRRHALCTSSPLSTGCCIAAPAGDCWRWPGVLAPQRRHGAPHHRELLEGPAPQGNSGQKGLTGREGDGDGCRVVKRPCIFRQRQGHAAGEVSAQQTLP